MEEQQAIADEAAAASSTGRRAKSGAAASASARGATSGSGAAAKRRPSATGAPDGKKAKSQQGATVEISTLEVEPARQESESVDVLNYLEDDFLK